MALQVWLPLNKNEKIENRGLSDITISGNPTYVSSGKLGGCFQFNSKMISIPTSSYMEMKSGNSFSVAFWVKGTSTGWLLACNAWEFRFREDYIQVHPGQSGANPAKYTTTTTSTQWRHCAFTWNNDTLILYVDGVLRATSTFSSNFNIDSTLWLCFDGTRYLNDFRVYNHCLSPKEVKEISKGLVLHYKMDDKIATNLVKNNTYNVYNNYGVAASLTKLNETFQGCDIYRLSMTPNSTYISDFKSNLHSHGVYGFHRTFKANTKYCFWIYYRPVSHSDVRVGGTASNINGWTEIPPTEYGGGWKVVGQYRNGSVTSDKTDNIFTSFYCPSAVTGTAITIDFCCPHLIEGFSEIIDDGDYQEIDPHTTVYDCSGFGNNGSTTSTTAPITNSDTARYSSAWGFNGTNYITLTNLPTFIDMSVSFWMKPYSSGQTACLINYRNAVGNDLAIFLIGGNVRFDAGGQTQFANYAVTTDWQHVCVTFNNSTSKKQLYINGVLKQEVTVGSSIGVSSSFGTIGSSSNGSAGSVGGNVYSGILSDYRIYATPLSAEDVKELYNTSAMVCNNGTVMAYSLEE